MNIYDFKFKKINGEEINMSDYKGKVILIVNTATKCGLAGQFNTLEELNIKYKDEGLVVLGFPCNQFANQEKGNDDEINNVCKLNFGVTFTLSSKIDVNGDNADPIYKYLKSVKKGMFSENIKWNFTKFLIDKEGNVYKRYAPTTKPQSLEKDILKLLK